MDNMTKVFNEQERKLKVKHGLLYQPPSSRYLECMGIGTAGLLPANNATLGNLPCFSADGFTLRHEGA